MNGEECRAVTDRQTDTHTHTHTHTQTDYCNPLAHAHRVNKPPPMSSAELAKLIIEVYMFNPLLLYLSTFIELNMWHKGTILIIIICTCMHKKILE